MDSGGITKKGLSNSNDQPCEIFGLRVRVDLVLYCSIVARFIVGGMVSGGITKKDLSNSNDQPCEICGLRVRVDLVLCVQYCNSVHSRGGWTVEALQRKACLIVMISHVRSVA